MTTSTTKPLKAQQQKKPQTKPQKTGEFSSLPNLLTYLRIFLVPVMVSMFFVEGLWSHIAALGIFILASITDFLDGHIARQQQLASSFGRMLDPIADKLLVSAALFLLVAWDIITGWSLFAAVIILSREILVSGLREHLAELKVSVPVSWLAKWKTTMQIVALFFLLGAPLGQKLNLPIEEFGLALLWLSAVLTIYTGYDYLKAGIAHFSQAHKNDNP